VEAPSAVVDEPTASVVEESQPVVQKPKPGTEGTKAVADEPDVAEKPRAATEQVHAAQEELGTPVKITNTIGMKLKLIPAGEFMMGSENVVELPYYHLQMPPSRFMRAITNVSYEKPRHKVRITKPFYLGVYEVTQAEYETMMRENPSRFSKEGRSARRVSGKETSHHPVENVSWDDATEFCKRLSDKEGETYRLPTEAEWEYACRAGTATRYSFGDDEESFGDYAWYHKNSDDRTHPAGEKKPNAWGLYDMHGNVLEWCADRYGRNYYAVSPTDDPLGPDRGSRGLARGGCWYDSAEHCRSAIRRNFAVPHGFVGFRVAAVPVDPSGK